MTASSGITASIGREFCARRWRTCAPAAFARARSTITMQVARDMFLTPRRDMKRKMSEIYISLLMEAEFTKEEIFSLYVNKIFLGQRAYGVGAAAEVYFGKSLDQLSLAEMATLAGIPTAPSLGQSGCEPRGRDDAPRPCAGPDAGAQLHQPRPSTTRRKTAPMESRLHGPSIEVDAPYVAEMVRNEMQAKYGDSRLHGGLPGVYDHRFASAKPPRPWRCARGCWNTIAATGGAAQPPRSICRRRLRRRTSTRSSRSFPSSAACGPPS